MVSPISNDKILPHNNERNSAAAGKKSPSGQDHAPNAVSRRPTDDTVELSSASQLANQEVASARNSGAIGSAAEARELVTRIREQIEAAASQALNSHGRLEKGQLTALLESTAA